ncbi:MAG TPA: hypothetical protein DEA96_09910 [Leptospiraceae bacterium]|nr:hypothetical protein [Leptospiraceae bacterium]
MDVQSCSGYELNAECRIHITFPGHLGQIRIISDPFTGNRISPRAPGKSIRIVKPDGCEVAVIYRRDSRGPFIGDNTGAVLQIKKNSGSLSLYHYNGHIILEYRTTSPLRHIVQ